MQNISTIFHSPPVGILFQPSHTVPPQKKTEEGRQDFNHLWQQTNGRTDRCDAMQRRLLARRRRATLAAMLVGRRLAGRVLLLLILSLLLLPSALSSLVGDDSAP